MNADLPTSFGALLQTLRKQKKIGQQPLADRLGVHRNTIGAWERGDRLPDTRGMVLELANVLQLDDEATRRLLEASLTGLTSYWEIPYPRNPFFSGRAHLLTHLHQQLTGKHPVALNQSYALSGLGGIGKTQLALEYAYQHAHDYHAIFWISAETIDTISSSFIFIAELLKLLEGQKQDQQQVVKAVHRWLVTHKDWLLIFDNVEDLSLIKPFLPPARAGAVLLTTRLHALAGLAHTLELSPFSHAEALRFLLKRAQLVDAALSLDEVPSEALQAATDLVKAMDGLPLALDQAGAYIESTGCSLSDYLHLFQHSRGRLLAERSLGADHPQSVVQTFLLSFEQLSQRSAGAADLLRLCALLHPDAIPEELIRGGADQWSPVLHEAVEDALALDQTLAELLRFSLVKRSAEQRALSLHRLVQVVLWEAMVEDEREKWLARALAALNQMFLDQMFREGSGYENWQQCERLLPHALVCLERADANHDDLVLASLAFKAGQYLQVRGRYVEAEPLYQRALSIRERLLGLEHAEVAAVLERVADLSQERGKYVEAEPLFLRAQTIYERQTKPDHLRLAMTLKQLALTYTKQGKYAEAETLFLRALHICEQQLGETHPSIAGILNCLALTFSEQGKYAEAEPLHLRALALHEQQLGPDHRQLASPLNDLAILYAMQGNYVKAEPLLQRCLHICEQQLGEMHPNVALPLHNLAEVYQLQGKNAEAEPLYQRALRIREQQLGLDHPLVASPLHGLAGIFQAQERYVEAEPLYQRALSIREQTLGALHPKTAETLHGLATLREVQGNLREATSLYQRALSICEQILGLHHPRTTQTRERLHLVLATLEKAQEAPVEQTET
jgi:tetratricopeptide (TPR) repeat protein/transcriptional regulator with XRE-family HTH domain